MSVPEDQPAAQQQPQPGQERDEVERAEPEALLGLDLGNQVGGGDVDEVPRGKRQQESGVECERSGVRDETAGEECEPGKEVVEERALLLPSAVNEDSDPDVDQECPGHGEAPDEIVDAVGDQDEDRQRPVFALDAMAMVPVKELLQYEEQGASDEDPDGG